MPARTRSQKAADPSPPASPSVNAAMKETESPAASKGSRRGKRKSDVEATEESPADASPAGTQKSPAAKKQKLAVRAKEPQEPAQPKTSAEEDQSQQQEQDSGIAEIPRQEEQKQAPPAAAVATPAPAKKGHIVFDEDGPNEFFTPLEALPPRSALSARSRSARVPEARVPEKVDEVKEEEDEDDDDDDAAPEAVSTTQAAAQTAKAAQAAAKAQEEQAAAQRRKRQERDARLKKQAEARKQRAAEEAEQKKKDQPTADSDAESSEDDDGDDHQQQQQLVGQKQGSSGKRRLPSVLPAEFLESDDSDAEEAAGARPKKIRLDGPAAAAAEEARKVRLLRQKDAEEAGAGRPRDTRVGSTVYRVVRAGGDARLGPRAHAESRRRREQLLVRSRAAVRKGGFFVNK